MYRLGLIFLALIFFLNPTVMFAETNDQASKINEIFSRERLLNQEKTFEYKDPDPCILKYGFTCYPKPPISDNPNSLPPEEFRIMSGKRLLDAGKKYDACKEQCKAQKQNNDLECLKACNRNYTNDSGPEALSELGWEPTETGEVYFDDSNKN